MRKQRQQMRVDATDGGSRRLKILQIGKHEHSRYADARDGQACADQTGG